MPQVSQVSQVSRSMYTPTRHFKSVKRFQLIWERSKIREQQNSSSTNRDN
jgi:hypothetical protein